MNNPWQELKSRLGPIQLLDLTRYDLAHAHRELGKQVSEQVAGNLDRRLTIIKPKLLAIRIEQARDCRSNLQSRTQRPGMPAFLRSAIDDYLKCLEAWADGLDLAHYSHPALKAGVTGSSPLEPIELAFLLQHDNVGCQTGLYRYAGGSVQLWHTEEDADGKAGSRFDQLRVASFQIGADNSKERFHAFIYPDLMPGPAFSWRNDGYIQAVDSLLLHNPPRNPNGMLANIICWLAMRIGVSMNPADMLKLLQPFLDGYALNLIWPENRSVQAVRYEFAGDRVIRSCLADDPGSYLFQVNTFSNRTDAGLQAMEALPERTRRVMSGRMRRTIQALDPHGDNSRDANFQPSHFFRLITSQAGREWAYANKDVKAHFLCQVKPNEMEIWLGAGPAGREDAPLKIIQKI
jgi:hypothetical protein